MSLYPARALERAMKIQEVILRAANSGKILWMKRPKFWGFRPGVCSAGSGATRSKRL